jgi:hypothetical protein
MLSSAVRSFSDPDAYGAAVRAPNLELVANGKADFSAKLISVGLRRLWMQRSTANAGGIACGSMLPGRAGIMFSLPPAFAWNDVTLRVADRAICSGARRTETDAQAPKDLCDGGGSECAERASTKAHYAPRCGASQRVPA